MGHLHPCAILASGDRTAGVANSASARTTTVWPSARHLSMMGRRTWSHPSPLWTLPAGCFAQVRVSPSRSGDIDPRVPSVCAVKNSATGYADLRNTATPASSCSVYQSRVDRFSWLGALRPNHLRPDGATLAGRDRLQRRGAYPAAYTLRGWRRGPGPNIRSAGLLTATGPRWRTWV